MYQPRPSARVVAHDLGIGIFAQSRCLQQILDSSWVPLASSKAAKRVQYLTLNLCWIIKATKIKCVSLAVRTKQKKHKLHPGRPAPLPAPRPCHERSQNLGGDNNRKATLQPHDCARYNLNHLCIFLGLEGYVITL